MCGSPYPPLFVSINVIQVSNEKNRKVKRLNVRKEQKHNSVLKLVYSGHLYLYKCI